ncbi:hypothetical protein TNIN_462421 [Trichonephila inaurata madagascariensis]|uniref:Uncharacterized protein n=1 Tax=Trichonephila inaurata madagascariensis TaxID=2747483 RepID=A0A8X6XLF4_9ARAC|nr:hypothetical protein TNIN_62021 [Trichonephila inaurata madagascariensis]GFY74534.1 hypothetical protein TNIN_462421 [Trichonephila inaurata madagascariensis]
MAQVPEPIAIARVFSDICIQWPSGFFPRFRSKKIPRSLSWWEEQMMKPNCSVEFVVRQLLSQIDRFPLHRGCMLYARCVRIRIWPDFKDKYKTETMLIDLSLDAGTIMPPKKCFLFTMTLQI